MSYLRCEACGAKALPLATRCPSCEAPFPARGPGTSPPRMRPCHACDSLVLHDAETCRWCGEPIRGRLSRPATAGLVATLLLLLVGGGSMMILRSGEVVTLLAPPSASSSTAASEASAPTPRGSAPVPLPQVRAPSTVDPAESPLVASGDPAGRSTDGVEGARSGGAGLAAADAPADSDTGATTGTMTGTATSTATGATTGTTTERVADAPAGASPPFGEPGWVRAVALTFVNVRSAPGSDSAVQGVVAENATVFLGDTRGAWRRIRSGNVDGWVWEPLFNVVSEGP